MSNLLRFAGAILAAVVIAGCTSSAATPATSAAPSATLAATPTETPTPTPTAIPSPTAQPTVPPSASPTLPPAKATMPASTIRITPAPRPDLVPAAPVFTPATPTCNVDFVVDVLVTNNGGPMPGVAKLLIAATRQKDGWIGPKDLSDIPIIASGSSVHLRRTLRLERYMTFDVMVYVDSQLWLAESHEDNNEIHKTINVLKGTCTV